MLIYENILRFSREAYKCVLRHVLNEERELVSLTFCGRAFHSCEAEQANDPL